jgi:hypothetical protein
MVAHPGSAKSAAKAAVTKTNRPGRRMVEPSELAPSCCESGAARQQLFAPASIDGGGRHRGKNIAPREILPAASSAVNVETRRPAGICREIAINVVWHQTCLC